ncbi:VOC family protein [Kordia algicida OT-1]|uniref:Glyoxalase/bleomycin resistance protein/dioxygenase n=1 Tax=Kordia algicida OT-1 TaxID=391587 RepID=A9ED81_9FLAO|nr:VOC family protein [Kordia algicida]EDP94291.1 Glyoxalase/bleomycin resistance protein/dioxygenase [Kordia algicida OT-1]
MKLGAFSVSLAVKDIHASKAFYENLGFTKFHGDIEQNWLIMKNEQIVIGLFQGMFEDNILTFNPGWSQDAQPLESFTDVREIQKELKEKNFEFATEADESTSGPASFVIKDPDGNVILMDQHV